MISKRHAPQRPSSQPFVASLVLATSVCALLWGCGTSSPPVPVVFELITAGSIGSPAPSSMNTAPAYRLITDAETWTRFWQDASTETPPSVPFDDGFVLCVYQGTQSTGGYEIRIDAMRMEGDVLQVVLELREPRAGDMLIQVVTDPYAIYKVRLPQDAIGEFSITDLKLRFVRTGQHGEQPLEVHRLGLP